MHEEEPARRKRCREHLQGAPVIFDLHEALDRQDRVVERVSQVLGEVARPEFGIADARGRNTVPHLLECLVRRIDPDNPPGRMAAGDLFGQETVTAAGVQHSKLASTRPALDRRNCQGKALPPRRRKQPQPRFDGCSDSRAKVQSGSLRSGHPTIITESVPLSSERRSYTHRVPQAAEWPNLFVVGVVRGGTTSLWGYFQQHPEIFMSPVKEPHFFTKAGARLAPRYATESAYLGLFSGATERIRGEASASYFGDAASPAAIKRVSPDAKILVILRDPVARAYSHYWHAVGNGHEPRGFAEAVHDELAGRRPDGAEPYVRRGFYSEALRRYLALFGDNVRVLFLEELSRDPATTLRSVFAFLGVDPNVADRLVVERRNESRLPRGRVAGRILRSSRSRKVAAAFVPRRLRSSIEGLLSSRPAQPAMAAETRELLVSVYTPDEDELRSILRRPLPWRQGAMVRSPTPGSGQGS